ncbi:MAG: acetyltransferase [Gammaproteobacteria bacterium]|nr:acetyltransferase [Gammaproteobacteria bacterium]
MIPSAPRNADIDIAEAVRAACIRAALDGYDNASISGLCAENAFEAAIGAIRMLHLKTLAVGEKTEYR